MSEVVPGTCAQCKPSGLPILPVRYTVVPKGKGIQPTLPDWAGGDRVKSVALGDDFEYALRTVRSGYIYLFYDHHARGRNYWECYMVHADGGLSLQPSPKAAHTPPPERKECNLQSNPAHKHYFVIEQTHKCGTAWIAFSEHKWSDETLEDYTASKKLRDKRMQTLHPAAMVEGAKHSHGAIATRTSLEDVLEYSGRFNTARLPYNTAIESFTKEDGTFETASLEQMSTRYPWALRMQMADSTVQHMQGRAKLEGGKPGQPHVLALWDAMGIAHELSGYRNDAAGWIKRYEAERAQQISLTFIYAGLQKSLETRAQTQAEEQVRRGVEGDNEIKEQIRELEKRQERLPPSWSDDGSIYDSERRSIQNQLDFLRSVDKQITAAAPAVGQALGRRAAAEAWPKYADRIDYPALNTFTKNLQKFQNDSVALCERRTRPLVQWLEAPLLVDMLNDFSCQNIEDGLLFDAAVSEAIFGMGACQTGADKINAWINEGKATTEENLLWRALALNQEDVRKELDEVLAEVRKHKDEQTLAATLTWTNYTAKSLKAFADTYKKAQGVFDANTKASAAPTTANPKGGNHAFGTRLQPVRMRGTDRLAISVGDAVFKAFRIDKLADFVSEKIIQHIFSIRAFVNPADSTNLIISQAKNEALLRGQLLQRVRTARVFMAAGTPEIRSAQAENLRAEWGRFRSSGSADSVSAIKDARLALVVALIEGVNFAKLLAECQTKGDTKTYCTLLASGMAITSAMFDIAATVAKNLPSMGSSSWSYQHLKLWGGVLSGAAGIVTGAFDLVDGKKNADRGYRMLAFLYLTKGTAGIASGVLTLAVAFTYSAPLVSRLAGQAAVGTAVRAVGARAAAFVGLRIVGMALGGWITVGLFAIQLVIWWVTPDALQVWLDHSAFGKERRNEGYKSADEQDKKLQEALVEMGFQ